MSEQPKSLRLADELEKDRWHISGVTALQSADELRRLHEEVKRLKEDRETLISAVDTWHTEVKRLRGVLKTDSEQQAEVERLRAEIERLQTELIRARLQTARYAEAWSALGETIGDAKRDLLGLKDKPIPDVRAARGES